MCPGGEEKECTAGYYCPGNIINVTCEGY